MNELESLRTEIDKIDKQLLPLFLERMDLCCKVAEYKRKSGKAIFDPEREKQVLENKMKLLESAEMAEEVYEFFNSIMGISRKRQGEILADDLRSSYCMEIYSKSVEHKKNPRVIYYGTDGSYSEAAAIDFFKEEGSRKCANTFEDAFAAVESGEADYAVLPIENSSTGVIADVVDLLAKYNHSIVGEVYVPIRHCLLGIKGARISDITNIYSHEQAILQCRDFVKTLGSVRCEPYYSTAVAAKMVAESGDKTKAAIGAEINAKHYNMEVLAREINTYSGNTTRFIVISESPEITDKCNKISVMFTLKHESGQLSKVLSDFARGGLNLLKLESRPIAGSPFEYRFFADYTGNILDKTVMDITDMVVAETQSFTMLGNYEA